jgi:hypothetical protein
MEKKTIKAVHDDDLEDVLKGLGIYNDFAYGKLKCAFCRDAITWDNLHSMFPYSGLVRCCCSKPNCVKDLLIRINEMKNK